MSYEKEAGLPEKPEWAITTAAKHGAFTAAVSAAIFALFSKLPVLRKFWVNGPVDEAKYGALFGGIWGALMGLVEGTRKNAEYPLKVENTHLRRQVEALETDKSFTKALLQQKIDQITSTQREI